ncbi:nicotinic acid mononucleotide adenylyltransferase [Pedobacter yulinensis]|uniref:Probable nicotinate-nucleotide adenylyltransferase n=1 Tax=Pedobacter yulinensis TaxID=2126353 RepID=A0A2T3HR29_9SPHI|nr:nicotinate (nicotinamide) nucleotide adenylyltransferase [Pedobacter yulinensis]PST84915.1 nicotinic acid mononucleotide adenylyltransferase [Pedobacter yulinensis]
MIGLFFGSFNPVHQGHLIIASYMANHTELEEVWFVVSPQNPLKERRGLAGMYDRLEMVNLATEGAAGIRVSDIEFKLPQPSYTVDTLIHLSEKYPNKSFALIMGSDNLVSLHKWKNYDVLLRDYRVFVYPRPGFDAAEWKAHPSVTLTDTPLMEISSSFIRKSIAENKSIRFFVPDRVIEFMDSKNMYR